MTQMTRKRVTIDGEDFFLEPLSPSVVKVEYMDQVGWIGVSKECDVDRAFAYQTWPLESLDEGVGSSMTLTSTPQSALRCLTYGLIEAQRKEESQRINPKALRGMAQWALQEYLEGLPDEGEQSLRLP